MLSHPCCRTGFFILQFSSADFSGKIYKRKSLYLIFRKKSDTGFCFSYTFIGSMLPKNVYW